MKKILLLSLENRWGWFVTPIFISRHKKTNGCLWYERMFFICVQLIELHKHVFLCFFTNFRSVAEFFGYDFFHCNYFTIAIYIFYTWLVRFLSSLSSEFCWWDAFWKMTFSVERSQLLQHYQQDLLCKSIAIINLVRMQNFPKINICYPMKCKKVQQKVQ